MAIDVVDNEHYSCGSMARALPNPLVLDMGNLGPDVEAVVAERWRVLPRHSLQTRLLYFMALGALVSLVILGSLGYLAVRQTLDRSLEEREVLARRIAAGLTEGGTCD